MWRTSLRLTGVATWQALGDDHVATPAETAGDRYIVVESAGPAGASMQGETAGV
jgi:hypothetical protein